MKLLPLILLLVTLGSSSSVTASTCGALFRPAAIEDSTRNGILMHGEHWVDLLLLQAGTDDLRPLRAFEQTLDQLTRAVVAGRLGTLNEKIDGSPSVVFGFTAEHKPFVAYKGHFAKQEQTLVTSQEEAALAFAKTPDLKALFAKLISVAQGPLVENRTRFLNQIFQGDVLFTRSNVTEAGVQIQANAVEYLIPREHELYESGRHAQIGIVFHSVGERTIDSGGRIGVRPMPVVGEEPAVKAFVDALKTQDILALHPWRDNVSTLRLTSHEADELRHFTQQLTELIRSEMGKLSPEFRSAWRSMFEAKWRTFLNAGLRAPNDGGFYKQAVRGRPLTDSEIKAWIVQFEIWLRVRREDALANRYALISSTHFVELSALLRSYATGLAIQARLMPFLAPALVSKIGGGEIEGLILKTDDSIIKWIDRLGFTLKNNARWGRESRSDRYAVPDANAVRFELPFPYNVWRPGASFVLMKGQPVHRAHIEMILEARENGQEIFVVASEKEPNLQALNWKGLGLAGTKKELLAREYTYIFDREFRAKLLRNGLPDDVFVTVISTSQFRNYLKAAKTARVAGKIKLVVGEKEVSEERYDDLLRDFDGQFELLPIPLKQRGLSATQVRAALKIAAIGDKAARDEALQNLDQAFAYIESDITRKRTINEAIKRWREVDDVAQSRVAQAAK